MNDNTGMLTCYVPPRSKEAEWTDVELKQAIREYSLLTDDSKFMPESGLLAGSYLWGLTLREDMFYTKLQWKLQIRHAVIYRKAMAAVCFCLARTGLPTHQVKVFCGRVAQLCRDVDIDLIIAESRYTVEFIVRVYIYTRL